MKKVIAISLLTFSLPLLAAASVVVGHSNSTTLSSGLVGYWPFDGNTTNWATGQTTDMSGNGNTGSLINMSTSSSPVAGKMGGAFKLTGTATNQYINAGNASSLQITTGTIVAWIKTSNAGTLYRGIVTKQNAFGMFLKDNVFGTYDWGGTGWHASSKTLSDNQWHQVACTFKLGLTNGTTCYVDGVAVLTTTVTLSTQSVSLQIGQANSTNQNFGGIIDDARVYNRTLSAAEIQQLYTSDGGTFAHSNTTLSTGLVGYWPMDGSTNNWATGQTTDMSGTGNTGSFISMSTSTSPTSGKIGQALQGFSATNYIDVPTASSLNPGSSITVSGWFYPTSNGSYAPFVSKEPTDGSAGWEMANSSGVFRATLRGSLVNVSAGSVTLNKWQMGTFTYDGATLRLYLNGTLVGSATGSATINSTTDLLIGKRLLNGDFFRGKVDDIRVYNRVLSAQDIQQLYGNGAGTVAHSNSVLLASGLVGYLPLDGNVTSWLTGLTNDLSGSGNNGTLNGLSTSTAPVAGKIGGAMKFSGATSQYVQAGGFSTLGTSNKPYTISAWVKPTTSSETGDIIHVSAASSGTGWCLSMLQITSGKAKALSWLPNPSVATGTTILLPNTWYHLVHTWSASGGLRLYVNGVLDASTPQATFSASGLSDFVSIGSPVTGTSCSNDAGTGFAGSIDDVRVYSRELSASEVNQLYAATK